MWRGSSLKEALLQIRIVKAISQPEKKNKFHKKMNARLFGPPAAELRILANEILQTTLVVK